MYATVPGVSAITVGDVQPSLPGAGNVHAPQLQVASQTCVPNKQLAVEHACVRPSTQG